VRAFVVIATPEGLKATLLCAEAVRGRPGRLSFELSMHPFMCAVLLRARRGIRWWTMPSCIHQTLRPESPWIPVDAKGVPLSVRIASGRPTLRNRARNTGLASAVFTDGSPRHTRRARLK
jgi:hypothetical protein